MDIITTPLPPSPSSTPKILLLADRSTLAKRRWRATAEDGREFGFDLHEPLQDGAPFFHTGAATYVISQQPEPVLEIPLATPAESARLGWLIGNLHFPMQITGASLRIMDDAAIRQLLTREQIAYTEACQVFLPMRQAHSHHAH